MMNPAPSLDLDMLKMQEEYFKYLGKICNQLKLRIKYSFNEARALNKREGAG